MSRNATCCLILDRTSSSYIFQRRERGRAARAKWLIIVNQQSRGNLAHALDTEAVAPRPGQRGSGPKSDIMTSSQRSIISSGE
jgi:hypothetical protein